MNTEVNLSAREEGELTLAGILLKNQARISPDNQTTIDLSETFRLRGKLDEALAYADKAVNDDILDPGAYLQRSKVYGNMGKIADGFADSYLMTLAMDQMMLDARKTGNLDEGTRILIDNVLAENKTQRAEYLEAIKTYS